jgi:hypothetical protein
MDEALVHCFFDMWELGYSAGAVKNLRLSNYHIMLSLALLTAMLWNHMREELGEAMSQLSFFLVDVQNGRCINISTRPSKELSLPSVWYSPNIGQQISRLSDDVLDKWLTIKQGMSDYGYFSLAGPLPGSHFATVYYQKVGFWFGILGLGSTSSIQYKMRRSRVSVPHSLLGSFNLQ